MVSCAFLGAMGVPRRRWQLAPLPAAYRYAFPYPQTAATNTIMSLPVVAVIGASDPRPQDIADAEAVGRGLAQAEWGIVTGGGSGVMEAASRGAQSVGGMVLGILPSADPLDANPYVTLAVATGMGEARNVVIANSAKAFVAIGGGLGTLTEIAFALKRGKPVVGLNTWNLDPTFVETQTVHRADSAEATVAYLLQRLAR